MMLDILNMNRFRYVLLVAFLCGLQSCHSKPKNSTLTSKPATIGQGIKEKKASEPQRFVADHSHSNWTNFRYFFDSLAYSTGITFFDSKNRPIGTYKDPENLKMLITDEEQQEIGESFRIVETPSKVKILVTIWLSGHYHRYRIFNPSLSTTSPVCDIQGEGDYPEKMAIKLSDKTISIEVQKEIGRMQYVDCHYLSR